MGETLLIAVLILAGFAIVLWLDVQGKARAYDKDPEQRGSNSR